MSIGILGTDSTPSTMIVSENTSTAYGLPSEARIKPFIDSTSPAFDSGYFASASDDTAFQIAHHIRYHGSPAWQQRINTRGIRSADPFRNVTYCPSRVAIASRFHG